MAGAWGQLRLHDLMDDLVADAETALIRQTITGTAVVAAVRDIRTHKMGDLIVVDAHIEVDAMLTVGAGHDITVMARRRVERLRMVYSFSVDVPFNKG